MMNTQANIPEQSLPNGLPPQFGRSNTIPTVLPFNGVDSSHSSRTSSPADRLQQIPASQLPPSRSAIPMSQLPPSVAKSGSNIGQITQNYANLNISHMTPNTSPKIQPSGTSTPLVNASKPEISSEGISPIRVQNTFMHSRPNNFENAHAHARNASYTNGQPPPIVNQSQTAPLKPNESNNLYTQKPVANGPPEIPPFNNPSVLRPQPAPVMYQSVALPAPQLNSVRPNNRVTAVRPSYPPMGPQVSQPPQIPLQPSIPPQQQTSVPPKTNRYPQPAPQFQTNLPTQYQNFGGTMQQNFQNQRMPPPANIVQSGFNKMWGQENFDLLQCPNILPPNKVEAPRIHLGQDYLDAANCSSDIFRCTMTKIPETSSLLQKSRLPLGILIHPFKDLDHLPVIQCSTIVRCRACRTYINPFVFFVDMKRWKCNLCYRVNELPEEFQFDPVTKTYGDPSRRPEIKSSTIEYIAPSEYMLRPPQPAVYLFLLDVSHAAIESGYLHTFCNVLTTCLSDMPGDARTQVGFIAYNSALHFYCLAEGLSQPHEMIVLDVDDVFLPCPDNLVVNLSERKELVTDLLAQLPTRFLSSHDTGSALGAALQAAHKLISCTGGRITVFQATLPTIGPGALTVREDPNQRAGIEVHNLNPANDFYKRLALECSGQQIAVDLFILNSQYVDLATISGISRFSGGCMYHFPLFKASRTLQAEHLERSLKRYLTRKIGFEAVMRIRCTRGLSIHTFHGNFFVRSTDLLSLPNVNPEAGFGMQVSIDESLSDLHTVCFQVALLYTSSKGERRIRVHTLCIPVASTLSDILASADQQCIVGLLAKMAVDRSMQSSLADAREAFLNVAIDILSSYKLSLNMGTGEGSGLQVSNSLRLLPLYISALLKFVAFRTGTSTRLDDRVKAMCDMKTLPLYLLIQQIYPDLYPIHNLPEQNTISKDGELIPQPPQLQLSARSLDSKGAFLMDAGEHMIILVGPSVSDIFLNEALGVPNYNAITDQMYDLPILDTLHNQRLNSFINSLNEEKPFVATLQIIKENSPNRSLFIERLIEDRIETALSYHEFLQHLKTQVK
ncbi:hypothetical protein PPYR_15654 [Photinus pyralis]|uniref:Protein transport protein Sec24A n=1 Tax=Photinus pyralis TaxID=7054 RepID=A0A1Y1NEG6_PHOPY|nr:protein transport protein Sec24A [Photinus pyralis]XP_031359231.1 protein transport protein Sec24A [Photinus pyralis]KAB0790749.1 hypothetical protein PPYR_15654 [Photinus pyralis]